MLYDMNDTIYLLNKFKKNYNFNNKKIAQQIGATEAAVSRWFAGKSKANSKSCEKIWSLFREIWIPGIIELPPNSYWSGNYYIRVDDIRNPFETWTDSNYTGYTPEEFESCMKEWKEKGQFKIVQTYNSYDEFLTYSRLKEQDLNDTREFLSNMSARRLLSLIKQGRLNPEFIDIEMLAQALKEQNERGQVSQ